MAGKFSRGCYLNCSKNCKQCGKFWNYAFHHRIDIVMKTHFCFDAERYSISGPRSPSGINQSVCILMWRFCSPDISFMSTRLQEHSQVVKLQPEPHPPKFVWALQARGTPLPVNKIQNLKRRRNWLGWRTLYNIYFSLHAPRAQAETLLHYMNYSPLECSQMKHKSLQKNDGVYSWIQM